MRPPHLLRLRSSRQGARESGTTRAPANGWCQGVCRYESRKRSQLLYCPSLGRNLSDCQRQTSQKRTSGQRRSNFSGVARRSPADESHDKLTLVGRRLVGKLRQPRLHPPISDGLPTPIFMSPYYYYFPHRSFLNPVVSQARSLCNVQTANRVR
jgi:hypothetical protein